MLSESSLLSFTDPLYEQMELQLEKIESAMIPELQKLSASLMLIKETMTQLRKYVCNHSFESRELEIFFFKYIKPKFYSWAIYSTQLYGIYSAIPKGPDLVIRDYFLQELAFIHRHFNQNLFLHQYYLLDEKTKDELFFLRSREEEVVSGQNLIFADDFSTAHDYSFAKFRAYEMLEDELIRRIRLLYQYPDTSVVPVFSQGANRTWTGDKINLIELAYGIYYTGEMNNGKAEIGDIVSWLEESLHIDLGRAYRKFIDIRRRKTISYTHFLDQMREKIHSHIAESDRYKPKPLQRK